MFPSTPPKIWLGSIKPFARLTSAVRSRLGIGLIVAILAGCSVIADPSIYDDWGYERFNRFQTFANRPLPDRCSDAAEDPATCSTMASDNLAVAGTIASSWVPWRINAMCRNRFSPTGDGRAPTRREVELRCLPSNDNTVRADENFIALGISGGGTKSAIFAAEAMFALDQWGMLGQTDAISSVSGGSFTAALYGLSCDPGYCDEDDRSRVRWQQPDIADRAAANLLTPLLIKRFVDLPERAVTHRTSNNVLAEAIDWRILARPDQSAHLDRSQTGFPALVRHAPDGSDRLEFRHLNPRRPNLILNAGHVGTDRQFLEAEAGIVPNARRLTDKADWTHFAFTDHYFETLLRSDLSRYPLANAVAASAAFPLIIDYATLGRFNRKGIYGNAHGIDFIHLTDGGVQDNHGLTEIRLALEDIFGVAGTRLPVDPHGLQPKRVLVMVLDSSLTDLNGVPRKNPHPLGFETALSPLRPFNVDQATSIMLATNAAQHDARLRTYFQQSVARNCDAETGPSGDNPVCAEVLRIGIERMDGYDSVLVGDAYFDCDAPEAIAELTRDPATLTLPVDKQRAEKLRQCQAMKLLRTEEAPTRLGLGNFHPQCYVEATRSAQTNFVIDSDMADCLRHAARWAVAMKMTELCLDKRFGGTPMAGSQPVSPAATLPIGIECPLPTRILPPLPRECAYAKIVNDRPWIDMPRQTAHCACVDRYNCTPEPLLGGRPNGAAAAE